MDSGIYDNILSEFNLTDSQLIDQLEHCILALTLQPPPPDFGNLFNDEFSDTCSASFLKYFTGDISLSQNLTYLTRFWSRRFPPTSDDAPASDVESATETYHHTPTASEPERVPTRPSFQGSQKSDSHAFICYWLFHRSFIFRHFILA
ncbi:uncharacterized protein ARMOST_10355 [Armillaria ostoyae]|uniref:Uncharacterized protein n=1 Tax=Armillaria ostoyae TaxID=47428 RepID=A0A284RE27_ARMOS|nr:uncharacterized protein ARMOST_10355 [Armillaria ostoyae]